MKRLINISSPMLQLNGFVIGALLVLGSCSTRDEAPPADHQEFDNPYALTTTQFTASNMTMGKLEMREFHEVVRANGVFDVPPQNRVSVNVYFGGYVKEVKLLPGERIKKGQTLFTLENPYYVEIQQEFLEAQGQLSYLKSAYERQKNLVADNVTSKKNYLKAEADYTVTRVKYEALRKKLGMMNINPNALTVENIRTVITVAAPITGYVTQVNITKGAFLNPSDVAVAIIDTEHLHLELSIFEKDVMRVAVGQPIQFTIQNSKRDKYQASVHLINKTVDSEKRTVRVHGHLLDEKATAQFNPGMYVEAEIYTSSERRLALPEDAVVEEEGKFYVLIQDVPDSYTFEKKEVATGAIDNGYVEILNPEDFEKDALFLTKGAFNLIGE